MSSGVNWRKVGSFIGLTYALTWLLFLMIFLRGGLGMGSSLVLVLQAVMLIPAFFAIILQRFVFRDSPLHRDNYRDRPSWFFNVYIVYTVLYLLAAVVAVFASTGTVVFGVALAAQVLTLAVLVFVLVLRGVSGGPAFARAGLAFGRARYWVLFGLLLFAFYVLNTWLNVALLLGDYIDIKGLVLSQMGEGADFYLSLPDTQLMGMLALQSIVFGSLFGLPLAFGEEFGWRGFLQGELTKLGRMPGVALVGVIWGLWHAPLVLMGYNYPEHPYLGVLLMTLYTVGLSFVFGHSVLRGRGIWIAAFLHVVNNQTYSFLVSAVYTPADTAYSFGIGLPGLVVLAVVVVVLLLDQRVWCERGQPAGAGVPAPDATLPPELIGNGSAS